MLDAILSSRMSDWQEVESSGTAKNLDGIPDDARVIAEWHKPPAEAVEIFSDDSQFWLIYDAGGMIRELRDFQSESAAREYAETLREE